MALAPNKSPLDISIPELSPNLVGRIVELVSTKGMGAAKEIEAILTTTSNQPTFAHGFTVLSRFGYNTAELLAMARQYNIRVKNAASEHPDWRVQIDAPVVNSLYITSDSGREGFDRYIRRLESDEFKRVD